MCFNLLNYTQKRVKFTVSKLHMKKSDFRKKKKRCGHCKGHFMWAPESVQPLLAPGRYSLWASNCDVPTALTQAQSRKLHLACSLCQGLSTPDHWCAPCCSKLLDSNFFFCQDRTRWFPFLGGLLFYGSLWRIPWVLRYHGSFLSLHMLPGCLGLEKIKAGPPPCYSLRTSTLTPEIPRPWGYVQHSTIFFFLPPLQILLCFSLWNLTSLVTFYLHILNSPCLFLCLKPKFSHGSSSFLRTF